MLRKISIKLYELSARDDIELISAIRRLKFCLFFQLPESIIKLTSIPPIDY